MASVDFDKIKTKTEAKRKFRHCDKDMRLQDNHANEHIDKSKTHLNLQMKDRGYETVCQMLDDRLADLDSRKGANTRKDRVILFGLNVPMPADLPEKDTVSWFNRVAKLVKAQCGAKNVLQGYIHFDEVHEYSHGETGKKTDSRVHATFYVIPEINGKLNGKQFSSRANMIALNEAIEAMSQQEYGVHFMTGEKKKSQKTVEELKNESRFREAVDQAVEERAKAIQEEFEAKWNEAMKVLKEQEAILAEKQALYDKKLEALDKLYAEFPQIIDNHLKRSKQASTMFEFVHQPTDEDEFQA